jgi:hypothetical protein
MICTWSFICKSSSGHRFNSTWSRQRSLSVILDRSIYEDAHMPVPSPFEQSQRSDTCPTGASLTGSYQAAFTDLLIYLKAPVGIIGTHYRRARLRVVSPPNIYPCSKPSR